MNSTTASPRTIDRYTRACNTARYGSTPAVRAAAFAEARRLRPLVHPAHAATEDAR